MNEPEVVERVHRFLVQDGLGGERIARLFTDPHPTLTGIASLKPFQRFAIGDGDFVTHPDLLGQQVDSESLIAIEAKGSQDLPKEIGQAHAYLRGVQLSFLAAPASELNESLVAYAHSQGVGVLAVSDRVETVYLPEARRPLNRLYNALISDLGLAAWMSGAGTFVYNLPTHYLVWVAALREHASVGLGELATVLGAYPMPRDVKAALAGARKLGLVTVDGQTARLSDLGRAISCLLPTELDEWSHIHRDLAAARGQLTLHIRAPQAAAVLRLLLLRDPIVQHAVEGLRILPPSGANFPSLAQACSGIDRSKALIFFMKPEAVPSHDQAPGGHIDWFKVDGQDFRSTTFFQYKSVLRHAGILSPHALGGATAASYQPLQDWWELTAEMLLAGGP